MPTTFTLQKEVEIDATPAQVFSYLDIPRNHVKITPSLVEIENVETLPGGGKRAEYRYKLAGVELVGQVEDVERSPGERLVQKLSGAIDGTIEYELRENGGTTVGYAAEYRLPGTVVDSVLAPVARAYNEREAEATLENLKTFLEN
jgi:uncharacterized protein YndB with AHSA1/START domain